MPDTSSALHLFADVLARVHAACRALAADANWPEGIDFSRVVVEPPRDASHGDMATNAAMVLAKEAKAKPRDLAEQIAERLRADALIAKVDVAGPGFINLTLKPAAWAEALRTVLREGADYGRVRGGTKVNVEYVSANPTGPMHVGHCRGAVFGDALASLLQFGGHDVTREYYINDAGAQVDVLARSAFLRYREALGENIGAIPEGLYPGDYLKPVGAALAKEHGDKLLAMSEAEWLPTVRAKAIAMMMDEIKDDLAALNIRHDVFFSERSLIETGNNKVAETIDFLKAKGDIYEGRLPPPKGAPVEDWEDREQLAVQGDRLRRRCRSSADQVGQFLHLLRLRYRLPQEQVRPRLCRDDRRLGRRPWRLHQADAGGGEGDDIRQGRARRQDRPAREVAAQRRAGENVEAERGLRHLA